MVELSQNIETDDMTRETTIDKFRRAILRVDGFFLLIVGIVSAVAEVMSHFWGIGLQGTRFLASPYTIGFFEAHGLALLIGILLIRAANRHHSEYHFWHGFAIFVHLLLGGANIAFWISFVMLDFVAQGVVATVTHVLLIALQLVCYFQSRPQREQV